MLAAPRSPRRRSPFGNTLSRFPDAVSRPKGLRADRIWREQRSDETSSGAAQVGAAQVSAAEIGFG